MSLFPFNTNVARVAQTDAKAIRNTLLSVVKYSPGSPGSLVADHYVTIAGMKVGLYTLAHTAPVGAGARNVTVTHATVAAGTDTLGTIVVTGTDLADEAVSETLTPSADTTVQGTKAFKTVSSVEGVGWILVGGNDTITVGFGDLIGLPDKLSANTVLLAVFNGVRETTAPVVTFSATALPQNTADLNSVLNASTVSIYYIG